MRAAIRRGGRRGLLVLAAAILLVAQSGCGYSFHAPFDPKIRTVYVPVFRSITFRRDVNIQLTELVIKEIERRSTFKVVGTREEADTILDGTINFADKNIVVENPFNFPRQLTTQMNAGVKWTHNPPLKEEIEAVPTIIAETINFVPEVGESSMSAFYRTNQALAKQIVDMMEMAW